MTHSHKQVSESGSSYEQTLPHRWFEEVWNQGRAEVIDEMLAPHVIGHGLVDTNGNEVRDTEDFKSFYQDFRSAFPDIHVSVEDTVSEGHKVMARCRVTATHTGEGFFGLPATGRSVEFAGMCLMYVEGGKIVETWNNFDFMTLMQQLGLVIAPLASE